MAVEPLAFARAGLDDAGHWAANGPRLGSLGMTDTLTLSLCVVMWAKFVAWPAYLEHDTMTAVSETLMRALLTIIISILVRLRTIPMQKPAFSSMRSINMNGLAVGHPI